MNDFGTELARLMGARGVGVRELARRVHYNAGHISNLRNGRARPSPELAADLDVALGADGSLAVLAPPPSRPQAADDSAGETGLIELARQAEVSDLGGGTIELLQGAADGLCRQSSPPGPAPGWATGRRQVP